MVNAAFVSDVQQRVPQTSCPSCGERQLRFELRCDLGSTECLFLARCGRCHVVFELDAESFPPGLSADSIRSGHILCPRCDQRLVMAALACSTSSRSCRYTLRCTNCDCRPLTPANLSRSSSTPS
jgi:transcription elongation factor Elf1